MRVLQQSKLLLLLLSTRAQLLVSGQDATTTVTADATQPTRPACGAIINDEEEFIFDAALVYDCLTSVPFNAAVATRFVKYYNDTLEFQSTVDVLRNPPESYRQPSVDLRDGLQLIQDAVSSNSFANQYEFELALQRLIMAAHDDHLYLSAGILSAFTFGSPFDLVSLSRDGIELPKVYLAQDVFDSQAFTLFEPSAIELINGRNVVEYLDEFAANQSMGALEQHTDWNQLMFSFAQDVQGGANLYGWTSPFYFGDSTTIKFENSSTPLTSENVGIYWTQGPTGPLETGGDFYNFFVLGFYPASFDPETWDIIDGEEDDASDADSDQTSATTSSATTPPASATSSAAQATSTEYSGPSWRSEAYPLIPDVAQPGLGTYGGGFFSGYFLNSSSIAVLSIPSFDEYDESLNTAHDTVAKFIRKSKSAGLKKVVIDLQQNTGGQVILAIDTFKQFFPNIDPFAGSQMRASDATNVMGATVTRHFERLDPIDEYYGDYMISEWVSSARINAETGSNFTSWEEFFGPIPAGDHAVTRTQRLDVTNDIFVDESAEGGDFDLRLQPNAAPEWAPEDIILLTDGVCGSSCALFVEMMHHDAGVRVVTAGGRPVEGPMQAVGNTRGARDFELSILDNNIGVVQDLLGEATDADFLTNRTEANDVFIIGASVNLRDQVRKGETTPLQFAYEPADCRIFFTPQTIFNYTNLWKYAADAIWTKPSLCVAGSTGVEASHPPTTSARAFDIADYLSLSEGTLLDDIDYPVAELTGDLSAGGGRASIALPVCGPSRSCPGALICQKIKQFATDTKLTDTCVPKCRGQGSPCPRGTCVVTSASESDRSNPRLGTSSAGYCNVRPVDNRQLGANRTIALLN
ncbi:hypothetical protein GGS20DRAFT_405724 [Poronia punctata]|nr:hypothetical protein GGS20DRAFT_405724 [Poronia punctata]